MVSLFVRLLPLIALSGCAPQTSDLEAASKSTQQDVIVEKQIMTWPDLTNQPLPEPTTSITYSDLPTAIVDVWLPDNQGPHPVVLMIHGGCWQKSIADRSLMNYMAEALRKNGMAVWNVEYRGVDEPGGGYPGTFEDVAMAGNALSEHALELNLDLNRVAGFGHSAGGHLITWYAGSVNLPEFTEINARRETPLKGIINSGGLADLVASEPITLASCLAEIRPRLTGRASKTRPDPYADTSSDRLLPTGVAIYNVNGEKDKIAPEELGMAYTEAATIAGDNAAYAHAAGEGHVELIAPGTKAFELQVEILKSLLMPT